MGVGLTYKTRNVVQNTFYQWDEAVWTVIIMYPGSRVHVLRDPTDCLIKN